MPNVTFNAIQSASNTASNFIAASVSTNFNNFATVVGSHGLDSDNYGTGSDGLQYNHISGSQIYSNHIDNDAVVAGKFYSGAIREVHMNYATSDGGVRCVRIGPAVTTSPIPDQGIRNGFFSKTFSHHVTIGSLTKSINVNFSSDTVWGNPGFTATPAIAGRPVFKMDLAAANHGPTGIVIGDMNSVSCNMYCGYAAAVGTYVGTVYIQAVGAGV